MDYPSRKQLETNLSWEEPYTLDHESRVIKGFGRPVEEAIRLLARFASASADDPTLELLWASHLAWQGNGISPDRLVAALVAIQELMSLPVSPPGHDAAAELLVRTLDSEGLPCSSEALEELFDGAAPACVGLSLVDIDWK